MLKAIVVLYFVLFFSGLFLVPIIYVIRTENFWKGVLLTWVLWLVLFWIHVCLYPFLVQLSVLIHGEDVDTGGEAFIGAIGMFIFGWIPGLLISTFGMLLKSIFEFFSKLIFKTSSKTGLGEDISINQ